MNVPANRSKPQWNSANVNFLFHLFVFFFFWKHLLLIGIYELFNWCLGLEARKYQDFLQKDAHL